MYQENECRWQLLEICRTSVRESHVMVTRLTGSLKLTWVNSRNVT